MAEIRDEIVQAVASALATVDEYDPNRIPLQLWPAVKARYEKRARAALEAIEPELERLRKIEAAARAARDALPLVACLHLNEGERYDAAIAALRALNAALGASE